MLIIEKREACEGISARVRPLVRSRMRCKYPSGDCFKNVGATLREAQDRRLTDIAEQRVLQ